MKRCSVVMRTVSSIAGLEKFCQYIDTNYGPTKNMSIVEVGAFAGDGTVIFAKYFGRVYAVDPWVNNLGDITNSCNMGDVYEDFKDKVRGLKNVEIIRDFSENASNTFGNKNIDVVYIDAMHTYEAVKKDIGIWRPKIKETGLLTGHDYHIRKFPGVVKAVNELIKPDALFNDTSWLIKLGSDR